VPLQRMPSVMVLREIADALGVGPRTESTCVCNPKSLQRGPRR
jgi:hypothetical protein